MMEKKEILVIGTDKGILETVVRLVNNNPLWNGTGACNATEAKNSFATQQFHLVLFGGGLTADEEDELARHFTLFNPAVLLIKHYGGGSGLLSAEIYEAFANRK